MEEQKKIREEAREIQLKEERAKDQVGCFEVASWRFFSWAMLSSMGYCLQALEKLSQVMQTASGAKALASLTEEEVSNLNVEDIEKKHLEQKQRELQGLREKVSFVTQSSSHISYIDEWYFSLAPRDREED